MSDEKVNEPIAELMEKIEAQYGKEAVEKTEYMMQEAIFAVNNSLLAEDVIGLMDPRLSQPVMREMLLARSEGVPTEELKKIRSLDSPELTDVSKIRMEHQNKQIEKALNQVTAPQVSEDIKRSGLDKEYAETLKKFVEEIHNLVADQQKANQIALDFINNRETSSSLQDSRSNI